MRSPRTDRGSVVVTALVVLLLGSIAVAGLVSYNVALLRSHLSQDRLLDLEAETDSAVALASSAVRRSDSTLSQICSSPVAGALKPPGTEIDIECVESASEPRAAGLVTTAHSSSASAQILPPWSGSIEDVIHGAIVINSGTSSVPMVSVLPDRQTVSNDESPASWSSRPTTWSTYATHGNGANPSDYPPLPPVPTYERAGAQGLIGTCTVYFPGRYLGTSSLVVSGGSHYFTSGVYYFERSLVITNGARVVMGSGDHTGCSNDALASSTGRAPKHHGISGSGSTLLFAGTARLFVQESSLIINAPRQGENSIAIRTVEFGTSPQVIDVPADTVELSDGSIVPVANHTLLPLGSSTPVMYKSTVLDPTSANAVDIRLNGTNPETNRVLIAGQIFIPRAGLKVASTTSAYSVTVLGGIVTTRLTTSLPYAPVGSGSGFFLGVGPPSSQGGVLTIRARTVQGSRAFTSSTTFDTTTPTWTVIGRTRHHSATSVQ